MRFDVWADEREKAEALENGLKVLRELRYGKVCAALWMPKALKPVGDTWYSFSSEEKREAWIQRHADAYDERQREKAESRKRAVEGDVTLADPGAIFSYSWGYDQTNVDYFQVVKRSGLMLTLAKIGSELTPGEGLSPMAGYVRPKPDAFITQCKVCRCGSLGEEHRPGNERYHEYQPVQVTLKKRLQFYQGEPLLSFSCGVGKLVKVHRFGNAPPLVAQREYVSWYA